MNKFSRAVFVIILLCLVTICISFTNASTDSTCPEAKPAISHITKALMSDGTPIVKVKRELYVKHPRPGVAVNIGVCYVGPGLERVESYCVAWRSDEPMEPKIRYSKDNGRTWSDFVLVPPGMTFREKYNISAGEGVAGLCDPASGLNISIWLHQIIVKGPPAQHYYNHSFLSVSEDNCRTWRKGQMLKYEQGADLDPNNPLDPNFLNNNQMYPDGLISLSNGTIVHVCSQVNIPEDAPFAQWGRAVGSACFVVRWDPKERQYHFQRGNVVWIPRTDAISLIESEAAELVNGKVLVIWSAHPFPGMPGRRWYSISNDGGLTLSEVKELKYDDTIHFYSPASSHKMIRHSVTGKLYWIGNITPEPALSRYPRYPLVIAEVDETIPALKRKTVTIIDDRQPQDSKQLSLSNFSLLENRQTHELELYLTRIGANTKNEENPSSDPNFFESDCYKYTLSFN